ncbi:MAG TPA: hypothetical protein PLJ78_12760 [Anaerolineae bacterium]|nr:hypothetical protein [Anaerolineae bacterium]HQK14801.1 hypothetical protein [Anaerolineae bacterium]
MKRFLCFLGLLLLLFVACTGNTSGTLDGEMPPEKSDQARSPLVLPTAPVTVSPTAPVAGSPTVPAVVSPTPQTPSPGEDTALTTLRTLVAAQLQMTPAELTLVSVEEVVWPDASLGCPQPGQMYAQVLTPGRRVVFADAAGHQYTVHTPEKPDLFIICSPTQPQTGPAYPGIPAVKTAIKVLAEREKVAPESIAVVSVEAVEWANSCLGCARPNENCLMVITPGYRIVLQSGAQTYNVHTDRNGGRAIICDHPSGAPSRADS